MGDISDYFKNYIKSKNVFKKKKILQSSFIPDTIEHRDKELQTIARILAPALKNDLPSNLFVYGKTGTGKTLVLRKIQEHMEKVSEENNIPLNIVYINCKMKKVTDTEYRLIAELSKMLGADEDKVPKTGLATSEIYDAFISTLENYQENALEYFQCIKKISKNISNIINYLDENNENNFMFKEMSQIITTKTKKIEEIFSNSKFKYNTINHSKIQKKLEEIKDYFYDFYEILKLRFNDNHFIMNSYDDFQSFNFFKPYQRTIVLILDEIDELVKKIGDEVLYTLTRLNSDLENAQISIVGISNDMTFSDNLEPRVRSSLREEDIVFAPYNAFQLQQILSKRVYEAFNENVIEQGVIEKSSAYAARDHGDARRALDLLRVAGEIAERDEEQKVCIEHIDLAEEKIEKDKVIDIVSSQPKQSQAALYSILQVTDHNDYFFTGDIYDTYKKVCSCSALRPLTMRRISDIIAELDTLGIINAQVMSKGRYGRTRKITLSLPAGVAPKLQNMLGDVLGLK